MSKREIEGMPAGLCEKAAGLRETTEFYRGWIDNPRMIGAVWPTSSGLAEKMASVVRPHGDLPVLELGPGTGTITRAILETGLDPSKLVAVERSAVFVPTLKQRFPGVNFVHGDAFDISRLARELGALKFDAVVSALPLLTMPVQRRRRLVESILDLLETGRPMVQFSYLPFPPAPVHADRYEVTHLTTVLRNFPPAWLWTYRRPRNLERRARRSRRVAVPASQTRT